MQPLPDASKYAKPHLPAVVRRSRLMSKFDDRETADWVVLSGQAAQGKTALAADYLSGAGETAAWLHLDERDAHGAALFFLLVHALIHAHPGIDLERFKAHSTLALGPSGSDVRYGARLADLWSHLPDGSWIVLDGLDLLPDDAPAFDLLRTLTTLPARGPGVLMTSRRRPPLPLQHLQIQKRLLVIANDELAFTHEEIRDYFDQLYGLSVDSALAEQVHGITGGWPGGLVLISQAMERLPIREWPRWLNDHLSREIPGEALRYFSEEVFSSQPESVQRLLIRSSLFDPIEPAVLDGICSGGGPSADILDDLVSRNLFIQRLHDGWGGRRYRLNRLFRHFLRNRFTLTVPKTRQKELLVRAAEILASMDRWEASIRLWLDAGAMDAAAAGIRKVGIDWVIRGRIPDLTSQLAVLPTERIQGDPWLFFLQSLTRRLKDGIRSIDNFKQALDRFVAAKEDGGRLLALAYLIEAHVFYGLEPAVCREWIQRGERILAEQSVIPYYAYAKTTLWMQIGFAYVVTGLDVSKGLSASQNAYLLATRIDDGPLKVVATLVSALGMALSGEFERADEALLRIGSRVDTGVFAEYDALKALVTVELALHRGDLEAAGRLLKAMETDIDTYGLLFLYPAFVDACGRHQIYEGQFEAAHRTCRHLMDVAIMAGSGFYTGLAHRLAALAYYHQNRHEEAAASLEQAMAAMPEDEDSTLHSMGIQLLSGLVSMHRGHVDEAEKRLRAALAFFSETVSLLSLAETHLALGLLHRSRGEPQTARVHLVKGGGLAQKGGFDHFVVISPADMICAGTLAASWLDPPERDWMARWPNPDEGAGAPLVSVPPTGHRTPLSLGSSESATGTGTILDIQTFGGFRVMRSGEVVMDGGKGSGGRPWLLLKAILVRGIREVPKELLMDDLWPDSTTGAAQRNLKVTLHRLRKLLEPDLDADRGSLYVHLKGNLVSLDRRFFRIDMEAFLNCCKDIKRLSLAGDVATVLDLGEKAMALYQGEFLPEEPYAPWVEMKRWALKESYTAMAFKMAHLYRRQGLMEEAAGCCRACLQADPCAENAARVLMDIYAEQGQRTPALQVFIQLREVLKTDVGVIPEPETIALYQRISGK